MTTFRHYLLTRVNVGFADGRTVAGHRVDHGEWLSSRLDIFERFTLPSVLAQTEKRFTWLLCFDPSTPAELRARIASYERKSNPEIRVVWTKRTRDEANTVFPRGAATGAFVPWRAIEVIERDLKSQKADWVLTTRLDSDDIISADFVGIVHHALKGHHFITLPRGYVYDAHTRQVWEKDSAHNAWITLCEPATVGKILSVWIVAHTAPVEDYKRVRGVTVPLLERGGEMRRWIAVRHEDNSTPLERGSEVVQGALRDAQRFSAVNWAREMAEPQLATMSFDDGGPDDRRVIEMLERHNVPATFYLVLKRLAAMQSRDYAGHEVASHTMAHPRMVDCTPEQLTREIVDSRNRLADFCGAYPKGIAWPGGGYIAACGEIAKAAGYRYGRGYYTTQGDTRTEGGPWNRAITVKFNREIWRPRGNAVHLVAHPAAMSVDALDRTVQLMLDAGYRFVTNAEYYRCV